MTWWSSRSHPKTGLVVAAFGLLIAFWSFCPWAQRPNSPLQSVYAGHVGDQRTQVLLLGLAIAVPGVALYCSAWRVLHAVSATGAIATLLDAREAIDDVSAVVADKSDVVSEVGWALYWTQFAAVVVIVTALVGLWGGRAKAG